MNNGAAAPRGSSCALLRAARVVVAALAVSASLSAWSSSANPVLVGGPVRPARGFPPGAAPETAPPGAHLTYYGGRVVSNAQVVQVLWGTGSYITQVTSTATPSIATFYQQVLNSAYVDWLVEYDTAVPGGTNQTIGRGSFVQQVTITPSFTGPTIDDTQIQSEIAAQLAAGHLPAPTKDAAGNTNTIYMIYFPHGKTITQGGTYSCQAGGFCGYHNTIAAAGTQPELYYGVIPDMQLGSGCETGCGNAATTFGNVTSVSSHEVVETITDPEVGIGTVIGAPLAWYDASNGEIGDICNAQQGSILGADGQAYVVQQEFSNFANDCVASPPVNDFSISLAQPTVWVSQGSSGSDSVNTMTVSGGSSAVALGISGLPPGVTGSFNPNPVNSPFNSLLTLNALASAPPGSYPFTVTGAAAQSNHATGGTLVVVAGSAGPLANGNFEVGNFNGWAPTGASETVVSAGCHGGGYCAQLGGVAPTNGDSSISQTFVAGPGASQLSFWYYNVCPDTVTYDWAIATLADDTASTSSTILPKTCATTATWTQAIAPLIAGHSYTLTLTSHDDSWTGDPTYTRFDDVTAGCAGPSDCDDGNPCTDDSCNTGSCVHTNNTGGCSDGNACTLGDTCSGGSCHSGFPVSCMPIDQCHLAGVCNPATGICSNPNKVDTTSCSDGNPCTTGDVCMAGVCGGTPVPAPAETQGVSAAADKATYSWSAVASATRYDVVRGSLASFPVGPGGSDETCFDNLPGATLTDSAVPLPAAGFWYLSRGENSCGNGTFGNQTNGSPRTTTTCP